MWNQGWRASALLLSFVVLFALAIPWWWQFAPETGNQLVWGAPTWFASSLLGSLLISIVAAAALHVAWNDEEDSP